VSASTPDPLTKDELRAVLDALAPGAPCDEGALTRALDAARAYAEGDGLDLFECTDLFEVAARLLIALAQSPASPTRPRAHALAATLVFLHVNGLCLDAPPDELVALTAKAARPEADVVDVSWAMRQHARPW
jgi:prophage maintenance system killer protein